MLAIELIMRDGQHDTPITTAGVQGFCHLFHVTGDQSAESTLMPISFAQIVN